MNPQWIPVADVMAVIDAAKQGKWTWLLNIRCKYIDLRIDMRDGRCVLKDRDGQVITIEQLKNQYGNKGDAT